LPEIIVGFHTADFVYLISAGTAHLSDRPDLEVGTASVSCRIGELPLMPGVYGVRLSVVDRFRRDVFYGEGLKTFAVVPGAVPAATLSTVGFFHVPAAWTFAVAERNSNELPEKEKSERTSADEGASVPDVTDADRGRRRNVA
jgi:hypothetical protein